MTTSERRPRSGRGRPLGVRLAACVAALIAHLPLAGAHAEPTPRPLTLVVRPNDPALRRLRAELSAIGLHVRWASPMRGTPTLNGASLFVARTANGVSLRVETRGPPPRVLSDHVAASTSGNVDTALVCARAVELVRASQYVPAAPSADVAPSSSASSSSSGTTPSGPPSNDPAASPSTVSPAAAPVAAAPADDADADDPSEPAAPDPPEGSEAARRSPEPPPPSVQGAFAAEIGPALGVGTGGFGPSVMALAALRWLPSRALAVGVTGLLPLAEARADAPEGILRLSAGAAAAGAQLLFEVPSMRLAPSAEAGVGVLFVSANATPKAPYTAVAASGTSPFAFARLGAAYPTTSPLRVRVDAMVLFPMGRPVVLAAGEARAAWGDPLVVPSLTVEAKW